MNKDKLSKLEDIREENFIWIIYLIIIILSYYANSKETKYLLFDDEESKKEYQGLLILIFSILVIVYYHFAKSSYNDYKKLDDNTYLVKADVDIDDMFEHFGIDNQEEYEYNTATGWVIENLDKIPTIGDSFDYKNMHVEVTDADSKTVNEIKITFKEEKPEKE